MKSKIEAKKYASRATAKQAEAKRYFTGNSCPHGHIADRFTSNGRCVECAYKASYSEDGMEAAKKYKRKRRALDLDFRQDDNAKSLARYHRKVATPEGRKSVQKRTHAYWQAVHKPRIQKLMETNENYASLKRERARKQSAVSRERPGAKQKQKESNRKYRQKNRAQQRYNKAMRRARTYNATPPWLSMEQKKKIRKLYEERQLRSEMEGIEYHVDHIIPLVFYDNVCGLHVPWNLQLLTEHEHKLKTLNEQKLKRKDFITDKMVAIYTG